jgi:hypothetical protein
MRRSMVAKNSACFALASCGRIVAGSVSVASELRPKRLLYSGRTSAGMTLRPEYAPDFARVMLAKPNGICTALLYSGVRNAFDLSVTY